MDLDEGKEIVRLLEANVARDGKGAVALDGPHGPDAPPVVNPYENRDIRPWPESPPPSKYAPRFHLTSAERSDYDEMLLDNDSEMSDEDWRI